MPRKQNGFGKANSFAFKPSKSVSKGKAKGAAGFYPSNRQYGSSVHRSVIEKYNLDSDWIKWRKGFEYYNKGAWYRLQEYDDYKQIYTDAVVKSKLYQGTPDEIEVQFDGYKFATKGADSNNHYVMKRTTITPVDLGTITEVRNDKDLYPANYANREIWVSGTGGPQSRLLLQMIGERLTDGETEATLDYVLTENERPALFVGKSQADTEVEVRIPKDQLLDGIAIDAINTNQDLVGKVCYIKNFYVEKPIDFVDEFDIHDDAHSFTINVLDDIPLNDTPPSNIEVEILDPGADQLPPSLYDISTLNTIYSAPDCAYTIKGKYTYDKSLYQRFYGQQYLTGDVVRSEVERCSYVVMPFTILGVEETDDDLILKSVPFVSEFKLYAGVDAGGILVFTDYSFTKFGIDDYDGVYYHKETPGEAPWTRLDTDVDPWMDEVFTSGNPLQPATIYTCSCPNHSHAMLRAPQSTQDEETRKINRQRRYPLPTAMGQNSFQGQGTINAAGIIESWESREHRMSFKMCKHSIAAMFIERLKLKEPNTYPTLDAREDFEAKLEKDMAEVGDEFNASYRRGGITALEVIFSLAQGLNLDDVELAYVVLNSTF